MAVANSQIEELLTVICKYVPQEQVPKLLRDLAGTNAYRANKSFATTIERLREVTGA